MARTAAPKLALKRGALIAAANWQVVAVQFVADSIFTALLAVPVAGGAMLVLLTSGLAPGDVIRQGVRRAVPAVAAALLAHPIALAAFLAAVLLVLLGGSLLLAFIKGGTIAVLVAVGARGRPGRAAAAARRGRTPRQSVLARARDRRSAAAVRTLRVARRRAVRRLQSPSWRRRSARWSASARPTRPGRRRASPGSRPRWPAPSRSSTCCICSRRSRSRSTTATSARRWRGSDACSTHQPFALGFVFASTLSLLALGIAASLLATAALGLIAFVPFVGLAALPLQVAAWVVRSFVFQYLGLDGPGRLRADLPAIAGAGHRRDHRPETPVRRPPPPAGPRAAPAPAPPAARTPAGALRPRPPSVSCRRRCPRRARRCRRPPHRCWRWRARARRWRPGRPRSPARATARARSCRTTLRRAGRTMGQGAAPPQISRSSIERAQQMVVGHDVDPPVVGSGGADRRAAEAPPPAGTAAAKIEAVQRAGSGPDQELIVERPHARGPSFDLTGPLRPRRSRVRGPRRVRRPGPETTRRAPAPGPPASTAPSDVVQSTSPSAARKADQIAGLERHHEPAGVPVRRRGGRRRQLPLPEHPAGRGVERAHAAARRQEHPPVADSGRPGGVGRSRPPLAARSRDRGPGSVRPSAGRRRSSASKAGAADTASSADDAQRTSSVPPASSSKPAGDGVCAAAGAPPIVPASSTTPQYLAVRPRAPRYNTDVLCPLEGVPRARTSTRDPSHHSRSRFRLPGHPTDRPTRARGARLQRSAPLRRQRRVDSHLRPGACREGRDPVRQSRQHLRGRRPAGAPGGVGSRRAGPRHLLRHVHDGRAAGRRGRRQHPSRVRPRRGARPRPYPAARSHRRRPHREPATAC